MSTQNTWPAAAPGAESSWENSERILGSPGNTELFLSAFWSHRKEELPGLNRILAQLFGGAKHPQSTATNPSSPKQQAQKVLGILCTSQDILQRSTHTKWKELEEKEISDIVKNT